MASWIVRSPSPRSPSRPPTHSISAGVPTGSSMTPFSMRSRFTPRRCPATGSPPTGGPPQPTKSLRLANLILGWRRSYGFPWPQSSRSARPLSSATPAPLPTRAVASATTSTTSLRAWWSTLRNPPATRSTPVRSWYPGSNFGIVGVNSGYPFISSAHPGNPCLADEYGHTPLAGLYVNTGFDPSYTDSAHTTAHCASLSATVGGSTVQRQAWAVGCSEAEKDMAYVQAQAITNPTAWWLDIEDGNSWCGLHGVNCDQTLNQFAIQGIIDTLRANVASPVGIYSNSLFWSEIVGTLPVNGATWDWIASGASTSQQAKGYCGNSFSGPPVS